MALTAKKVYAILKRQISDMEAKLNSPVRYRGTVATADLLPLNPDIGDMYNIESKSIYGEAGMNVAWNGVVWDTMGAPIDMSLYIKLSELADWAKQPQKPDYTAEEVGALPANTKIPSKTSDLQNDSGFLTKIPDNYLSETDKTLSVSGKAADAKATGDKITELSADISNKLNKNQGSENSGKIAGINESGDIVPMFPVSVDYNEETNCLEFGSDQKMELNKGINLDSTLTKTGYAADAGAVGEITNSLKEDLGDYKNGHEYMPIINGQYVNGSTGVFINDNSWSRTDYVDCSKYSILVFENNTKTSRYNAFYNANKEFVSNLNLDKIGENIIVVPQNATYFVLSNETSKLNDVLLKSKLNLDIETILEKIGNATDIKFVFEDGYYIDSSTGEKKADSSWKCSGKVELPSNAKKLIISFYGQNTNNPYNAFYDSDNNRIGKINILANTSNQCFIIPNDAKYFSISVVKSATISVKSDLLGFKELNYSQEEYDNNKFIIQRNSLNTTIHSISRMGFSNDGYPKESINAFKKAIKMGFDAIRCNYRITSDGVPVSLHDANINSKNARMKNGTTITSPVDVDTLTFDTINKTYNFSTSGGINYPITKFEDVVKLCKKTGTTLYVEMKIIPTNAQCDTLITIVKKYGMEKNVQFIGFNASQESVSAIKYIAENSNVLRVGIMLDNFNDSAIQRIGTIRASNVSVFIWGWDTMDLTGYIDTLISNGIEYEMGTIDTKEGIISYFDTDVNNYCIGVESNSIVASKVIIESVIN